MLFSMFMSESCTDTSKSNVTIKEIFVSVNCVSLAFEISLAAQAAAQSVHMPLTFHLCGGCAVAICANSKISYNLF